MSAPEPPTSVDHAFDVVEEFYGRVCETVSRTSECLKLEQRWESVKLFLYHHPLVSIFLVIMVSLCTLPILIFTAFAIGSFVFMFITFVFFEGVLLSVGLFILVGVLGFLTFFALGVSIFVAGAGYMFIIAHKVANSIYLVLQPQSIHRNGHRASRRSSTAETIGEHQGRELINNLLNQHHKEA